MSRRMSMALRQEGEGGVKARTGGVRFPPDLVFLDNIKENDLEAAKEMLRRASIKMDINGTSHAGLTPLHQACLDGNLAAVQLLVENGGDVNRVDEDTWTPLHAACAEGHLDVTRWLLDNGADPNILTAEGERPLDLVEPTDFAIIALMLSKTAATDSTWDDSEEEDDDEEEDEEDNKETHKANLITIKNKNY